MPTNAELANDVARINSRIVELANNQANLTAELTVWSFIARLPRWLVGVALVLMAIVLLISFVAKQPFKMFGMEFGPVPTPIIRQESPLDSPIGSIVAFSGVVGAPGDLPEGWMLCDGTEVPSAERYVKLRNILKATAWGRDGDKSFLPDLRGLFLRGVDDPDAAGGRKAPGRDEDAKFRRNLQDDSVIGGLIGSVQSDSTRLHKHPVIIEGGEHTHSGSITAAVDGRGGDLDNDPHGANNTTISINLGGGAHRRTGTTDEVGGVETRPKNAYVNYIIRAYWMAA